MKSPCIEITDLILLTLSFNVPCVSFETETLNRENEKEKL